MSIHPTGLQVLAQPFHPGCLPHGHCQRGGMGAMILSLAEDELRLMELQSAALGAQAVLPSQ